MANWKLGYAEIIKNDNYAWKVTVTNVDDDEYYVNYPIVLSEKSVLTLIATSEGSSDILTWDLYLIPDKPYTLEYNKPVDLYFVGEKIYSQECGCQVFLTLFGSYPTMTPIKDYGQTIPFEAIRVVE